MNVFKVEIKETLGKVIEVKANSVEKAISKIEELYKKEEIVLDGNDYISTEISEYNQNIEITEKEVLVNKLVDYLFEDEKKHYEEYIEKPEEHMYLTLLKLKSYSH